MISYDIICPACGYTAPGHDFDPSCADECECPLCEAFFTFEYPEDDTDWGDE